MTLGGRRHFGVWRAALGDGRLGGALHHRLVFAVAAVGCFLILFGRHGEALAVWFVFL